MPNGTTQPASWLNRTTVGAGLTSLFSDWNHEIATTLLAGFLASLGAGSGWLGVIEGTADGLSSVAKLTAGYFTDRLKSRKSFAVIGYAITAVATGALALATNAEHVLVARVSAWLGRGARTPVRKALLAAAVPKNAYGRAFGFERMLDTTGAIVGPLTALWLLHHFSANYHRIFWWTLVPGALAVASFAILVKEKPSPRQDQPSFWTSLSFLPARYRKFLFAVGIFGLGDFAHTLLILYATRNLTPGRGLAVATTMAVMLYMLHNVFYAAFAYVGGWLGDRFSRRKVLALGYAVAFVMALFLATGRSNLTLLATVFILGGIYVGIEEALEDSLAAELTLEVQHGMAFGTLAAVNAVGDFVSSSFVGLLWGDASPFFAFGMAGALFLAGALLIMRLD